MKYEPPRARAKVGSLDRLQGMPSGKRAGIEQPRPTRPEDEKVKHHSAHTRTAHHHKGHSEHSSHTSHGHKTHRHEHHGGSNMHDAHKHPEHCTSAMKGDNQPRAGHEPKHNK